MSFQMGTRGVLIDIEGTTTAISFVYDVLFPFAEARLEAACTRRAAEPENQENQENPENPENPEITAALALLRAEHASEPPDAGVPPFGSGAAYARYLMARDRKSTGLKLLQGLIWEEGYRSGELRAHLFPDVAPALAAWHAAGLQLRVFSSGSRQAQQLLFAHTEHGDLTPLFSGFHDTSTGPKLEPSSYRAIGEAFALPPARLLFLSDTVGELDAAAAAGYRTALLERPGNRPHPPTSHPIHRSLTELAENVGLALPSSLPPAEMSNSSQHSHRRASP